MHCDEFDLRMQDLLDLRKPPEWDGDLRSHALNCAGCQERLRAQEELFEGLAQFDPPPPVRQLVVERPTPIRHPGNPSWRPYLAGLVCVAACLLLFFTIRAGGPIPTTVETQHAAIRRPVSTAASDDSKVERYRRMISFAEDQLVALDALDSNRLRSSLRPLTSSFHVALDALRRTLPIRSYWPDQETT